MSRSIKNLTALLVALFLLCLMMALSLVLGEKSLASGTVMSALNGQCTGADCVIVTDARVPRTLAGLLAGMALGLSGALMQILTRNPLADPGILGVNAGAAFAVVIGIAFLAQRMSATICGSRLPVPYWQHCWSP